MLAHLLALNKACIMEVVTIDREIDQSLMSTPTALVVDSEEEEKLISMKKELFSRSDFKLKSTDSNGLQDGNKGQCRQHESPDVQVMEELKGSHGDENNDNNEDSGSILNNSCVSLSDVDFLHNNNSPVEENDNDSTQSGGSDISKVFDVPDPIPLQPYEESTPVSIYFRIAFVGCLEYTDEWIEAFSAFSSTTARNRNTPICFTNLSQCSQLLAPLGQRSQSNRGYYHTRPEIKYMIDLHRLKEQQEAELHDKVSFELAVSPRSTLVSPLYAKVVNSFLRAGGMEAILQKCCGNGQLVGVKEVTGPSWQECKVQHDDLEVGIDQFVESDVQPIYKPLQMSTLLILLSSFTSMSEVSDCSKLLAIL